MILHLKVEISRAEDVAMLGDALACLADAILEDELIDLSVGVAAEGDPSDPRGE